VQKYVKRIKNMLQTNKIISKALLPKLAITLALSFGVPATCVYVAKQKIKNSERIGNRDTWLMSLTAFLLFGLCFCTYNKYKEAEKFSTIVARKYLKESAKDMPEMKIFDRVLTNPKALTNVANLVFNSLRPSEQKMVKDIVSKALADVQKYEICYLEDEEISAISRKSFAKAREDIIKVIQGHASVHPEFVPNVYKAMAYADMTYIVQQRTR